MDDNAFNVVKQIYTAASVPVVAADEKYNILWKNPAAEACELFDGSAVLFGEENPEGMTSVYLNGDYHIFNVIKFSADNELFIIEYVGRDTSRDISHMKDYFCFLCARLRESASQLTMAADDIDLFIKMGDTDVAPSLNRINKNIKLLLKEALVPETLFYIADPLCKDNPINLAHAVGTAVSDAEKTLGRLSDVWQNEVDDVCAEINSSVFETIIAFMTAKVCCGEFYPERLEFTVERDAKDETRGTVSVRSICLSDKKNAPFSLEMLKKKDFFTDNAFRQILAEKYGISFELVTHSDGIECIMQLDVLPKRMGIVKTDKTNTVRQERFSPMAAALSEKHCLEHYKNIKMN